MRPRPTVPSAITIGPPDTITVVWRDGRTDVLRARDVRLACRCARCVDESTGRPLLDPATVPADLSALDRKPIGNYATQFLWSDGHRTGLYTHDLLRELGGG